MAGGTYGMSGATLSIPGKTVDYYQRAGASIGNRLGSFDCDSPRTVIHRRVRRDRRGPDLFSSLVPVEVLRLAFENLIREQETQ